MTGRSLLKIVARSAGVAALSLALAVVLFHFLFQPFQVAGLSMAPALEDRDFLLVDRVFFRLDDLRVGDIVVFRSPADGRFLVKRVAALPGDAVEVTGDGSVRVNGHLRASASDLLAAPLRTVVPPGALFLIGDNAGHSQDSRSFGAVPFESLYGRVLLRYYPPAPIPAPPRPGSAP